MKIYSGHSRLQLQRRDKALKQTPPQNRPWQNRENCGTNSCIFFLADRWLLSSYCRLSVSLSEQMTRHRLQQSAVVATIGCGDNNRSLYITIVGPRYD